MPGDGSLATYSAEYISKLFTGVQHSNLWPQARLHTQWPGVRTDLLFLRTAQQWYENRSLEADLYDTSRQERKAILFMTHFMLRRFSSKMIQ